MDFDQRLDNRSYATVRTHVLTDRHGFDVCTAIAKVAFRLNAQGESRIGFRPVRISPVADQGALHFPCDLVEEKVGTDIGLVGTAHPTLTREVKEKNRAVAWLQVGTVRKVIQIGGPCVYKNALTSVTTTDIGPIGPTPLRYDLAYGGFDAQGNRCGENPIGRGFAKDKTSLIGHPAPQLEPVYDPLRPEERSHPSHATFAPIWDNWEPRRSRMGTCDAAWAEERGPVRPLDFDLMHNSWAAPGLHCHTPLRGDEAIEVGGVLPEGTWRFKLPLYPIFFESVLDDQVRTHPTHLDGLLIDADERVVELTYRASIVLPMKWERLQEIRSLGPASLDRAMLTDEPWPKAS
jgi:hypothetical protein